MARSFTLAALATAATIVIISLVLIPQERFNLPLSIALALFTISIALPIASPSLLTGAGRTNAGSISSVGLAGFNFAIFFVLSAAAFLLSLLTVSGIYVWVACVGSAGWLIVGTLIAKGAIAHIDETFPNNHIGTSRSELVSVIDNLKSICAEPFKTELQQIDEKLRYSPNDLARCELTVNAEIMALITGDLATSCRSEDLEVFRTAAVKFDALLSKRNAHINSMRTKI